MSTTRIIVLIAIFIASLAIAIVIQQRQNQLPENTLFSPTLNADESWVEEDDGARSVAWSVVAENAAEPEQTNKLFYFDGEPYPYFIASYRYALDDVQKEFDRHYPRYLQGDAESTYAMSVIARHCLSIFPIDPETNRPDIGISEIDIRAAFNQLTVGSGSSVESLEALENAHVEVLPACIKLVNVIPKESTQVFEFVHSLVKASANAGSQIAKLEMLDQYIKVDYRNFKESAKLLENVIRSKEPNAYQQVIGFYSRFRNEEQESDEYDELNTWSVLRCNVDKNCKPQVMKERLISRFSSVIVDEIYHHANLIDEKISSGEKIGFRDYRQATDFAKARGKDVPTFVTREEISWSASEEAASEEAASEAPVN